MGILISRFRKKTSTKELLENIEKDLEDIEDFKFYTQQQQKRLIGSLIIYSIITYIIAAVIFYFYYFPSELSKQILYSLPLIAFPVVVWIIKQLLHWYYRYKLSQNEDQIILLHRERKKLLKEVMEKETYKVAKEILEKYDPEQIKKKTVPNVYSTTPSNAPDILARLPELELRKRAAAVAAVKALPKVPLRPLGSRPLPTVRPLPTTIIKPGYNAPPSSGVPGSSPVHAGYPGPSPLRPSGIRMPCPILPQQRGVFDKMIEYVVGDGPNNRYALICRQCQAHNGMALREEFEYTAFRCCYCFFYNPSRKQRPMAPRLSLPLVEPPNLKADDKMSSTDESETEGAEVTEKIADVGDQDTGKVQTFDVHKSEDAEPLVATFANNEDDANDGILPSDDIVARLALPTVEGSTAEMSNGEPQPNEECVAEPVSNTSISESNILEEGISQTEEATFETVGAEDVTLADVSPEAAN